jgi:DNA-binding winged helix-turn-helix (wHTH) protein
VTFRFATFCVNTDTRQLLDHGREVHLSPKAFELLLTLVEHRARALSKAELQKRLWPTTFVSETNLATLISEIRHALGDSAREAAYVRTVQRFGYRFVAQVDAAAGPQFEAGIGMRMSVTSADREFVLAPGANVMGRAHDAAIRIDAGGVSRHHARIDVHGQQARLADLGSKNGTFVNGTRVTSDCLLSDGVEIRLGPVALTFRLASTTQVTETVS